MMDATLSSKGQITLPKEARERLNLKPGSKVRFFFTPDGELMLLPVKLITALKGGIPYSGPPLTEEDIRAACEEGGTMRWRRFEAQMEEERKLREKDTKVPATIPA